EVLLSPSARHLAKEKGIDVRQVSGTGPGGRITKEDVLGYLEQQPTQGAAPAAAPTSTSEAKEGGTAKPPPPSPPAAEESKVEVPRAPRETRQRLGSIRLRIAERLVAAQHAAAILTTFNEADLSGVIGLRNRYKEAFGQKYGA